MTYHHFSPGNFITWSLIAIIALVFGCLYGCSPKTTSYSHLISEEQGRIQLIQLQTKNAALEQVAHAYAAAGMVPPTPAPVQQAVVSAPQPTIIYVNPPAPTAPAVQVQPAVNTAGAGQVQQLANAAGPIIPEKYKGILALRRQADYNFTSPNGGLGTKKFDRSEVMWETSDGQFHPVVPNAQLLSLTGQKAHAQGLDGQPIGVIIKSSTGKWEVREIVAAVLSKEGKPLQVNGKKVLVKPTMGGRAFHLGVMDLNGLQ